MVQVSETFCLTLERLLVATVEGVPTMYYPRRYPALRATLHLLLALQTRGAALTAVLSGFGLYISVNCLSLCSC